jgi:hypothetical protein
MEKMTMMVKLDDTNGKPTSCELTVWGDRRLMISGTTTSCGLCYGTLSISSLCVPLMLNDSFSSRNDTPYERPRTAALSCIHGRYPFPSCFL